jgi:hypothetical protein
MSLPQIFIISKIINKRNVFANIHTILIKTKNVNIYDGLNFNHSDISVDRCH